MQSEETMATKSLLSYGFKRLPGRRYEYLPTGEVMSRRQAEARLGRASFEAKAKASRTAHPLQYAARPARGRKSARGMRPRDIAKRYRELEKRWHKAAPSPEPGTKPAQFIPSTITKKHPCSTFPPRLEILKKVWQSIQNKSWVFSYYIQAEFLKETSDNYSERWNTIQGNRIKSQAPDYETIETELTGVGKWSEKYGYIGIIALRLCVVLQRDGMTVHRAGLTVGKKKKVRIKRK